MGFRVAPVTLWCLDTECLRAKSYWLQISQGSEMGWEQVRGGECGQFPPELPETEQNLPQSM